MAALPDGVKKRVLDQWCPTCRAEGGDPCINPKTKIPSDGSWWHRAREYGVVDDGAPLSRVCAILMTPCVICGAEPGERCWTKPSKSFYKTKYVVEQQPRKGFHKERQYSSERTRPKVPLMAALETACPKCTALPEEPCWRRTEDLGNGRYRHLPREEWVPAKRPHWERWRAAERLYQEGVLPARNPMSPEDEDGLDFLLEERQSRREQKKRDRRIRELEEKLAKLKKEERHA